MGSRVQIASASEQALSLSTGLSRNKRKRVKHFANSDGDLRQISSINTEVEVEMTNSLRILNCGRTKWELVILQECRSEITKVVEIRSRHLTSHMVLRLFSASSGSNYGMFIAQLEKSQFKTLSATYKLLKQYFIPQVSSRQPILF
jgi:hypothetical protein